jgi:hypothetical protein
MIFHQVVTRLHFYEKGVKMCLSVSRGLAKRSCETLNTTVFDGQEWVFQEDSATAQEAKMTNELLWRNHLDFNKGENWLC